MHILHVSVGGILLPLSAVSKTTFLLHILFFFIICFILSLIFITCISQKEQRNTIIRPQNTKSPVFFFFLFFYFRFCWSILQFSCFPSKNVTAKVKPEASLQKSLKRFLTANWGITKTKILLFWNHEGNEGH